MQFVDVTSCFLPAIALLLRLSLSFFLFPSPLSLKLSNSLSLRAFFSIVSHSLFLSLAHSLFLPLPVSPVSLFPNFLFVSSFICLCLSFIPKKSEHQTIRWTWALVSRRNPVYYKSFVSQYRKRNKIKPIYFVLSTIFGVSAIFHIRAHLFASGVHSNPK